MSYRDRPGFLSDAMVPPPVTVPPPPPPPHGFDLHPLPTLRQVRYGTFSGNSGWIVCRSARVEGQVLFIVEPDGDSEIWVPLHYVRGRIEYRAHQAETPQEGEPR